MRSHRLLAFILLAPFMACQADREEAAEFAAEIPSPDTEEGRIASALSAAPASVSAVATLMDWEGNVLREGTNQFTCLPDNPEVPNNSPMCLDPPWLELIDAWMNRREPSYDQVGIGYMLQGDKPVSNVDPFAEGPTPDNQWMEDAGPHIMIAVPDPALLEGITTDPDNGGPWVMWKGTPYAHLMLPAPKPRTK